MINAPTHNLEKNALARNHMCAVFLQQQSLQNNSYQQHEAVQVFTYHMHVSILSLHQINLPVQVHESVSTDEFFAPN